MHCSITFNLDTLVSSLFIHHIVPHSYLTLSLPPSSHRSTPPPSFLFPSSPFSFLLPSPLSPPPCFFPFLTLFPPSFLPTFHFYLPLPSLLRFFFPIVFSFSTNLAHTHTFFLLSAALCLPCLPLVSPLFQSVGLSTSAPGWELLPECLCGLTTTLAMSQASTSKPWLWGMTSYPQPRLSSYSSIVPLIVIIFPDTTRACS